MGKKKLSDFDILMAESDDDLTDDSGLEFTANNRNQKIFFTYAYNVVLNDTGYYQVQ